MILFYNPCVSSVFDAVEVSLDVTVEIGHFHKTSFYRKAQTLSDNLHEKLNWHVIF